MFAKNILYLHLKDKLFFLLVALLAITGIYFGARAAIGYLSGSVDEHKEELHETQNKLKALEDKYGAKLEKACDNLENFCAIIDEGLLGSLNRLSLGQAAGGLLLWLMALKIIFFFP